MLILPDRQYRSVPSAHQRELGHTLARLRATLGVCRVQRRRRDVLLLAMPGPRGQKGQKLSYVEVLGDAASKPLRRTGALMSIVSE